MAQTYPDEVRRAAVVIGVDATGGLPTLNAAASGAVAFAQFLREDGFDVHEFLSSNGPVREQDITLKMVELVGAGNLNQLVIYFAGHGLMRGGNEVWLLSGAPVNAGEAVTVLECQRAARGAGITNVVLIGDTCRSLPATPQFDNMPGSLIFPNLPPSDADITVDTFYATQPGDAALEVEVDKAARAYKGIFTSALIEVFSNPPEDLVMEVKGVRVIPNRRLRMYMRKEVNRRAEKAGIALSQKPDLQILSDEPWNIGKVRSAVPPSPAPTDSEKLVIESTSDALRFQLETGRAPLEFEQRSTQISVTNPRNVRQCISAADVGGLVFDTDSVDTNTVRNVYNIPAQVLVTGRNPLTGTVRTQNLGARVQQASRNPVLTDVSREQICVTIDMPPDQRLLSPGPHATWLARQPVTSTVVVDVNYRVGVPAVQAAESRLEASRQRQSNDKVLELTGIAIYGATVKEVVVPPGITATGADGIVVVDLGDRQAATVVLLLDNTVGLPIAVLRDYGAHVTVSERGVDDIRYTPTTAGGLYDVFASVQDKIIGLRAVAREAAQSGVLGFVGTPDERKAAATKFAAEIRILKGIDPTLGIYAAYAYDAANLPAQVASVADIMQSDLGIEVCDPAMLARRLGDGRKVAASGGIVPFCPVLRQGWELLRVKNVALEEPVTAARPFLTQSLFTAFTSQGAEGLADAVRSGAIE